MAFMQKKKIDEPALDAAQGSGDGPEQERKWPVMHIHKGADGKVSHMHFLGGSEQAAAAHNPHLDNLLKRLEERREDDSTAVGEEL